MLAPTRALCHHTQVSTGAVQIDDVVTEAPAEGWKSVRADDSIQYAPVERPEAPPPPGWLEDIFEFLGELFAPIGQFLGSYFNAVLWILAISGAALLAYILYKLLAPVLDFGGQKNSVAASENWAPAEAEALALLEDADRLAAAGDYDGATHLLLQRSVGQIAQARPDWVEPSSTARELAGIPALPDTARTAFATIADRVERNIFALQKLGADDWQTARGAYASFALQKLAGAKA